MQVAKFTNELIELGASIGASDIHFMPNRNSVIIYMRIDGKIVKHMEIEAQEFASIIRFLKYKSKIDLGYSKIPKDGSFIVAINQQEIYVRISIIPLVENESVVIRLLSETVNKSFKDLATDPSSLQTIYEVINEQDGLFVFTGPTGSGKSTSMYSLLEQAAIDKQLKVICIEDPVEVLNNNFTQIQIDEGNDLTYSNALKACLRHDPDIIMIGEIRDEETAKNVFRAALTGHTVISTMHTKDKYGVIERFKDFGFKPSEIKSILIGISNQRLVFDQIGNLKSFYDYSVNKELEQLINNGEDCTIHEKIGVYKHGL